MGARVRLRAFRRAYLYAKKIPKEEIYLCNWYIKLVRPGKAIPEDQVQCHVPLTMTKFDIRNYFEKIYGIDVIKVNTRIQLGKEKVKAPNVIQKQPDFKVAYITLANQTFRFPDLFAKFNREGRMNSIEEST